MIMRGYVFILEAVFAGLILLGFMLYLAQGYTQSRSGPEQDFGWVLPELDQMSLLRGHVYSGDIQGLEGEIAIYGFNHSVQVCDPSGGCLGQIPQARDVWVSAYFLAGEDSYQPREVRLYVWEA
jgi:hypothetical protein